MSEKAYCWQAHVPPSKHNGGWALIMHGHRILALPDDLSDQEVDAVITLRESKIDEHGEPPIEFVKAWLQASADLWKRATIDPDPLLAAYARAKVEATRAVWRRMISTNTNKETTNAG